MLQWGEESQHDGWRLGTVSSDILQVTWVCQPARTWPFKHHLVAISWKIFRVHNPKKSEEFLHRFFNQNKYSSFCRQLNLWGFKHLTQNGADNGAYYHKMFLCSKPFLCRSIRCKAGFSGKQNNNNKCAASNSDTEPRFCLMAPLPPSGMLATSSVSASPVEATRISCNDTIVSTRTTRRSPFDIPFDATRSGSLPCFKGTMATRHSR